MSKFQLYHQPVRWRWAGVVLCSIFGLGNTHLLATELVPPLALIDSTRTPTITNSGEKLKLSVRRVNAPTAPSGIQLVTIRVPEIALAEGWRCCWIEAYSTETARMLSQQFGRTVVGNSGDLLFDAARTEAGIRQIAPGTYQTQLAIGSKRIAGVQSARLYVHLYRPSNARDYLSNTPSIESQRGDDNYFIMRNIDREARYFLDEPILSVSLPAKPPAASTFRHVVPSQLPN